MTTKLQLIKNSLNTLCLSYFLLIVIRYNITVSIESYKVDMMLESNRLEYKVTNEIDCKFFIKIVRKMEWKMISVWDDYNEFSHC